MRQSLQSLKEYLTALGRWGWLMLVDIFLSAAGAYLDVSGQWSFLPTWLWLTMLGVAVIIAPFIAFHKVRVQRDEALKSTQNDPIRVERQKEHFEHLAEITSVLLEQGNLKDLEMGYDPEDTERTKLIYVVLRGEPENEFTPATLKAQLNENLSLTRLGFGNWEVDYFISHIKAEYSEGQFKNIESMIEQDAYDLVDKLRILYHRKTFKGKCPICKDW